MRRAKYFGRSAMRLLLSCLLVFCLLFCSTACVPAQGDPFAYAAAPFSVTVEGTYLPASDPNGTPRPFAARVTVGAPMNGDPTLRDLTVTFTSPDTLAGVTVTATPSPATDGGYGRAVTFSYPSDYGEVGFTATGDELDGLLRFAEALLPIGDVAERAPTAEDGSYTVTRRTADGGREAVFVFAEGMAFPRRVSLTDGKGWVELMVTG
jgi:hypothetical protein